MSNWGEVKKLGLQPIGPEECVLVCSRKDFYTLSLANNSIWDFNPPMGKALYMNGGKSLFWH